MAVGDALLGQVGVDRGRAHADQDREVVHVEALAGTQVDRGEGAQPFWRIRWVWTAPVARIMGIGARSGPRRACRSAPDGSQPPRTASSASCAESALSACASRSSRRARDRRCSRGRHRGARRDSGDHGLELGVQTAPASRAGSGRASGSRLLVEARCPGCRAGSSRLMTRRIRAGNRSAGWSPALKFCRKKWCRLRDTWLESTASGASSPMEPTASLASATMGWRISSRSSMESSRPGQLAPAQGSSRSSSSRLAVAPA